MTPETDAAERMAYSQEYMVPTEFARKLERERDEALSQIVQAECRAERFCQERDEAREDATNYYAKIGELTQERDEAREAFRLAENERVDMAKQLVSEKVCHAKCQNERDEAREALKSK